MARYLTVNMSEASLIVSASMLDNWFIFQVLEIKLFITWVAAINLGTVIPNALATIKTYEEEADVITANVGNEEPGIGRQKTENDDGKPRVWIKLSFLERNDHQFFVSFVVSPQHSVILI